MKIVLDDLVNSELKEYLLLQEGILDVEINKKEYYELNIKYDDNTTPIIIMKYIELFQKFNLPVLMEFDKGTTGKYKTLKYKIDDICCEYCYKGILTDLFQNEKVKSVKSDFVLDVTDFEVNLTVEYDADTSEQEIIDFIKEEEKIR